MAWLAKGEFDKALADEDEAIRLDSRFTAAYLGRALVWEGKGEFDKALADYDEALRLDPKSAKVYSGRSFVWTEKGEFDKALADANEALRLDPRCDDAYLARGNAWRSKGDFDKAIADNSEAIQIQPRNSVAYNNRAVIWATCPDEKYRDAKRALESATRACELTDWNEGVALRTLAAAYAESGDFEAAVKWQEKSIELCTQEKDREKGRTRLQLYRASKPYREPPGAR